MSGDQEDVVDPAAVAVYCSGSSGTDIPYRPVEKLLLVLAVRAGMHNNATIRQYLRCLYWNQKRLFS